MVDVSNGNNIEAKRNDTSIIGVFLVSKRNKPTYSRTRSEAKRSEDYYFYSRQDQRNNEYIQSRICWIEEKTNIISLKPCRIEAKRTDLIKIYAGLKQNEPNQPFYKQDRRENEVLSLQRYRSKSKPCQSQFLRDRSKKEFLINLAGSKGKRCGLVHLQIRLKQTEPRFSEDRSEDYLNLSNSGLTYIRLYAHVGMLVHVNPFCEAGDSQGIQKTCI